MLRVAAARLTTKRARSGTCRRSHATRALSPGRLFPPLTHTNARVRERACLRRCATSVSARHYGDVTRRFLLRPCAFVLCRASGRGEGGAAQTITAAETSTEAGPTRRDQGKTTRGGARSGSYRMSDPNFPQPNHQHQQQQPQASLPFGIETIKPGAVRSMTTDKLASFSLGGTKKTAYQARRRRSIFSAVAPSLTHARPIRHRSSRRPRRPSVARQRPRRQPSSTSSRRSLVAAATRSPSRSCAAGCRVGRPRRRPRRAW